MYSRAGIIGGISAEPARDEDISFGEPLGLADEEILRILARAGLPIRPWLEIRLVLCDRIPVPTLARSLRTSPGVEAQGGKRVTWPWL